MNHLKPILAICLLAAAGAAHCQQNTATTAWSVAGMSLATEVRVLTALQERVTMIESNIPAQVKQLVAINDPLFKQNVVLRTATALRAKFPADATALTVTPDGPERAAFDDACKIVGLTPRADPNNKAQVLPYAKNMVELDTMIRQVRRAIDLGVANLQGGLTALQATNARRNEAFNEVAAFLAQMRNERASLIGTTP